MPGRSEGTALLRRLLAANARRAAGAPALTLAEELTGAPVAALVCCSELGPQPERLFGYPEGSLLVLQGLGVCLGASVVAGLQYAVVICRVRLVMILAHDDCTLTDFTGDGPARLESTRGCADPEWSTRRTAEQIEHMPGLARYIAQNRVCVAPLVLDRRSSLVSLAAPPIVAGRR